MPHLSAEYVDRNAAVLAGQIDILQHRESELRALLDAVNHEKHTVEAQCNQLENDCIPFHWLPPELLIYIFVLATLDSLYPIPPLDTTPLNISHVCQRWRDVALSTPTLWRRVVLTPSDLKFQSSISPATQTYLDRSRGVPIEVFCAALPSRTKEKTSLLAEGVITRSISTLRERHEHHRLGKSYILRAFPPLRSLHIHGDLGIIVDALAHLHTHFPGFTTLESLELALEPTTGTPGELYDRLRLDHPERTRGNPWRTYRFPALQALTLRDIPLAGIALGQLPTLRDITLTLDSPLSGRLEFLRLLYLARLLACAPHVERLALLRAGPVFSLPLDTSPQAMRSWEDDAAWRADNSRPLPPILLEHLRELEWTDVHPETLHLLLKQFPIPRLEVLDIAFASPSKCKKLAAWLHPTFVHELDSMAVQPALELPNLKVLRADCSSGDVLRTPFFRLYFPALETLSLSNRNKSLRRASPRRLEDDDSDKLPQLPRLESIFRDPRMPHLTHLLLSGFSISPEHTSLTLEYMPCLQRLDCNFISNISALLEALAAATARSGLLGVRVCPRLRHIQLWCCDGVESATLTRLVKLRNGFASEDEIVASCDDSEGKRPIKPLPKGAHLPTAEPMLWHSTGTKKERRPEKVEHVSVEGCCPITGEEARALRQWGVEVEWVAAPGTAVNES